MSKNKDLFTLNVVVELETTFSTNSANEEDDTLMLEKEAVGKRIKRIHIPTDEGNIVLDRRLTAAEKEKIIDHIENYE